MNGECISHADISCYVITQLSLIAHHCPIIHPHEWYCTGLQSETENATNTLRSLPSDDDSDNLPLVLQREESLKVKGEWSSFVSNDACEGN